jgi:N-acetylglucosaminyl-diphospho-decaprenol L-rhamnosyltransferase
VNPDIRLLADPFPALLESLQDPATAVAGPLVLTPDGKAEDSARRFPTAGLLIRKVLWERRRPDYPVDRGPLRVDWIAGMFMLFHSSAYRSVDGFDEAYFLYYEDVDLCRRLGARGNSVVYDPRASVVHQARRASRRSPALAVQHFRSAMRFLLG